MTVEGHSSTRETLLSCKYAWKTIATDVFSFIHFPFYTWSLAELIWSHVFMVKVKMLNPYSQIVSLGSGVKAQSVLTLTLFFKEFSFAQPMRKGENNCVLFSSVVGVQLKCIIHKLFDKLNILVFKCPVDLHTWWTNGTFFLWCCYAHRLLIMPRVTQTHLCMFAWFPFRIDSCFCFFVSPWYPYVPQSQWPWTLTQARCV